MKRRAIAVIVGLLFATLPISAAYSDSGLCEGAAYGTATGSNSAAYGATATCPVTSEIDYIISSLWYYDPSSAGVTFVADCSGQTGNGTVRTTACSEGGLRAGRYLSWGEICLLGSSGTCDPMIVTTSFFVGPAATE